MFNVYNDFKNVRARSGLYRVWIRASSAENAPLVGMWIDPMMRAFEHQDEEQVPAMEAAPVETEPVPAAIQTALSPGRTAWEVHYGVDFPRLVEAGA